MPNRNRPEMFRLAQHDTTGYDRGFNLPFLV